MIHKFFNFQDNKSKRWWFLAVIPILLMAVAIGLYLLNSRDKAVSPTEQTTETTKAKEVRIRFHGTNVGAKVSLDQKVSSAKKAENTDEVSQTDEATQKPTDEQLPSPVAQSSESAQTVESQNLAGNEPAMSDAEKAALEMERQQLLRELAEMGGDEPEKQARFATYPIEKLRMVVRVARSIGREHEAMFQRKYRALYERVQEIRRQGREPTPQDYEEFNRYWKARYGY